MIPSFLLVSCNLSRCLQPALLQSPESRSLNAQNLKSHWDRKKKWNVFVSCCGLLSHHSTCRTLMKSPWKRFTEWTCSNVFTNDIQCICILSPPKESRLQTAHLCIVILFTMHASLSMSYVLAIAMGTVAVLRYRPWCRPECFSVGVALRGKWSNHPIDVFLIPLGSANASPAPQG